MLLNEAQTNSELPIGWKDIFQESGDWLGTPLEGMTGDGLLKCWILSSKQVAESLGILQRGGLTILSAPSDRETAKESTGDRLRNTENLEES